VSLISQHGKSWPYWFRKMGKVSAHFLEFVLKFNS